MCSKFGKKKYATVYLVSYSQGAGVMHTQAQTDGTKAALLCPLHNLLNRDILNNCISNIVLWYFI